MEKKVLLWIVIGVLFIAALFLVFSAGASNTSGIEAAGTAAKSAASTTTPSSYGGMVGGC